MSLLKIIRVKKNYKLIELQLFPRGVAFTIEFAVSLAVSIIFNTNTILR